MEIFVYAHWAELEDPLLMGTLSASMVRSNQIFRFSYDDDFLGSSCRQQIDPDLSLVSGSQFSDDGQNFRTFLDSCPDRWGRLLMKRREAVLSVQEDRKERTLYETDFLIGVHDNHRMGALRFKLEKEGDFLDDNASMASPPMAMLRDLEYAASYIENNKDWSDPEYLKWMNLLISPGSSLGGARPKASIVDSDNHLWLAKFPSRYDDVDVGCWEYVTYQLAIQSGIEMAECRVQRFKGEYHTFLAKRFDRVGERRLHFSSAMTQLGYCDGDYEASYLELAEFLWTSGSNTRADLQQLWRRIVFNIAVSNTDDHLRNHGFLLRGKGWVLSPAYDVNPNPLGRGLHLAISETDNSQSVKLALSVIDYFQLEHSTATEIVQEVHAAVSEWSKIATSVGLSRESQKRMSSAFRFL